MKIPTLLALIILSLCILLGIYFKQNLLALIPSKSDHVAKDLVQSNLTPHAITIVWSTDSPNETNLLFTTDKIFFKDLKKVKDDRDQTPTSHLLHFVTISDLQPNTTYYYRIDNSNSSTNTGQFKTPSETNQTNANFPPIVGSVVDSNLKPIKEALVTLQVLNHYPLATYTSDSGNFILSLIPLYQTNNLTQKLDLAQNPDVTLTVTKGNQSSRVDIHLSKTLQPLPPITLGQDLDLRNLSLPDSSATQPQPSSTPQFNFDINGDGKVNSIDLSIIQANIGKKKFNPMADINGDGVVDQKDLDLIKSFLQQKS